MRVVVRLTQGSWVARSSQPWAERCNPFGIERHGPAPEKVSDIGFPNLLYRGFPTREVSTSIRRIFPFPCRFGNRRYGRFGNLRYLREPESPTGDGRAMQVQNLLAPERCWPMVLLENGAGIRRIA